MSIQKLRRIVEWGLLLLYILLPFLKIKGESVLRFDVPTLKLHVFGVTLWMQEFYYVMLATLFLVLLFLFLTLVFGRVWCGWMCPQSVYTDLTLISERLRKKTLSAKIIAHLTLLIFSSLIGFITVCYFVSPYEAIPLLLYGHLGPVATGSTIVLGLLLYVDLAFLRRTFCATICPYAKLQGAMTDNRSLIISIDEGRRDECIHCKKCCKVCPTGLDIRKGMQVGCVMCAACIDACQEVMAPSAKKGLIRYQFGVLENASFGRLVRPVPLVLGLLALFMGGVLFYQGMMRQPFDFAVLSHTMEPKSTKDGGVINAFILSVKNMEDHEVNLDFDIDPSARSDGFTHSITMPLTVPAGLVEKFPLFIRSRKWLDGNRKITVSLKERIAAGHEIKRSMYFTSPE